MTCHPRDGVETLLQAFLIEIVTCHKERSKRVIIIDLPTNPMVLAKHKEIIN